MTLTKKILLPAGILVAGLLIMMGLLSMRSDPPMRAPQARTKIVETSIVHLQPVQAQVTAYGRVTSAQPVQLYAEVAGTLEQGEVPFKPAQRFSKGQLLIKIDDRQARFNLNSATSDLLTALATLLPEIKIDFPEMYQTWQDYFDACRFDKDIDPLPETDNPRIKLFLSRFNVYKLYFAVRNLEILLDKHMIRAPFDGAIVTAGQRVGSTARSGSLLGEIINLEQLEVAVPVKADNVQWIDRGRPVRFTSSEVAGEWTGKIVRVGSEIDTRTQTVDVYISVDNDGAAALLNGVFLEAHIPGRNIDNAVPVPPRAIYEDRYVYLIVDGKLEQRDITVVRRETNQTIVAGGIKDNDTLVVDIMQGVAPGMAAQSKSTITEQRGN